MARPRKTGLDYFPFDCDFFSDQKMIAIAGEFGIKGEIVAVKLLCEIYHKGYFVEWNDLLQYKLAYICPSVSAELINQIVIRLVKWGLFDSSLFYSERILTSVEIQQNYFEATKFRIPPSSMPYLLIIPKKSYATASPAPPDDSQPKTGVSQLETSISQEKMPQIKQEQIKLKRKNSLTRVTKNAETGVLTAPTLEEVEKFFKMENLLTSSPRQFHSYYAARGWRAGTNRVTDWKSLAISWNERENKEPWSSYKTSNIPAKKSESQLILEADLRRKKEAEAVAARQRQENPHNLSPAEILALAKQRHGIDPSKSLSDIAAPPDDSQPKTRVSQLETSISQEKKLDI